MFPKMIYLSINEKITQDKIAIIDIMIRPTNESNNEVKEFSDFWIGVFSETWITTDETKGDFVGVRTTIEFDMRKNDYCLIRKPILSWGDSIKETIVGKKKIFTMDMIDSITSFYMDAHRDVVDDMRSKKSYFGRATSQKDLSEELVNTIENQLNDINKQIVDHIPALKQTSKRMSEIGKTIGSSTSNVEIEPLARKITDLHKGMDIVFNDRGSAKFSISQHGMGTRSWVSFLTLGAYVDWHEVNIKKEDAEAENYVMLTMEEPEAHLHPQAQRQIYSQILGFSGQKIISTHSPSILAQAKLSDIIHVEKIEGKTQAVRFDINQYTKEEMNRIEREVVNTRGELLFSNAIVFCEGITEELALPIFFREYFGNEAIFEGINIIGIGGQHYKTFLSFIKDFKIPWFIFSDGEEKAIKSVKGAIKAIGNESLENMNNIIILDGGEDYEKHLLANGYGELIIEGISECECDDTYFSKYFEKHNNTLGKRIKTDLPKCEKCQQDIYVNIIKNYEGEDGRKEAIYDCCTSNKAKYASYIAEKIVIQSECKKRIPAKVKLLFDALAQELNLEIREEHKDD